MKIEQTVQRLFEFDDVLLEPIPSAINSRDDVNISSGFWLANGDYLHLNLPVIASPMKGIVGANLVINLGRLGGIGILHRFYDSFEDRLSDIFATEISQAPYGVAIGLDTPEGKIIVDYLKRDYLIGCKILCVDVANGYTKKYKDYIRFLSRELKDKPIAIMAGNVADYQGVRDLFNAGAQLYRVGIGSGQLCTTRNKTGVGYPQLSALLDIQEHAITRGIVSDGGIKSTGDIVKALAGGADLVMIGSMFAKTFESDNDGVIYGMASKKLQNEFYGKVKSVEGISKEESKTMSLKEFVDDIDWSIRSACTYLDAPNLQWLRNNAKFIVVGNNSIEDK